MNECGLYTAPYKNADGKKLPAPTDHYTLTEREQLNAPIDLDNFDILCTVRDPLERFMSGARYHHESPEKYMQRCKNASPSEVFIPKEKRYQHCRPQTDYTHTASGRSLCTHMVHQENINEEIPAILEKYGCKVDHMPLLNLSLIHI